MGNNKGSKFIPKEKPIDPASLVIAERPKQTVRRYHQLYNGAAEGKTLITYAFPYAAEAVKYFGDDQMPPFDPNFKNHECLLRAKFNGGSGLYDVERVIKRQNGFDVTDVLMEGLAERDVVRKMKSWTKDAGFFCESKIDLENFEQGALLVTHDPSGP